MTTAASQRTPVRVPRGSLLVVGVAALVACLAAVVVGRAAAPAAAGLQDPGPVVRWGLPIVRALRDLAAALTIGLLVLGTVAVPDRARAALDRVPGLAVSAGVVWVVAAVIGVVLGFADIVGMPPTSPGFLTQFQTFVWQVETLRDELISAGIAAMAVSVAALWRGRTAIGWAGAIAVVALAPLALTGHAAGTAEHETAVNALAFHLVGSALWVGGLLAIALLRPALGQWLPVVVERYSTIAGWCLLAVGLSGLLSASVRMASPADLATDYGALIVAKVLALVVLGLLGLTQRRRIIVRLRQDVGSRSLFARFVVGEVAVMGVAMGVAAALSRTGNPNLVRPPAATMAEELTNYPMPDAPSSLSWLTTWRWDWLWGTVAVVAILLYVGAVARLYRRGDRWPVLRTMSWTVGWLGFIWATSGSPGIYGRVSFSWHMISHMVIAMVVPILLVLAAPLTLVMRVEPHRKDGTFGPREILLGFVHSRYLRFWANPVVAAAVFFGSLVVFYYSPLFEVALTTHTGHVFMVVHFLLSGYLFAMVLVGVDPGPPKWAPPLRLVVLFATISFHAFFGVALATGTTLLAPDFFTAIDVPWIPDVLADQQRGGTIAWGIGEFPSLFLALLVTLAWVRADDHERRRHDRQADRDGDADLAAYNAQLQALAAHDAERAARERNRDRARAAHHGET